MAGRDKTKKVVEKGEVIHRLQSLVANATLVSRSSLYSQLLDVRRDYDKECGYPETVEATQYLLEYKRGGIGKRVVACFPEECWSQDPRVYETEESDETEFEAAWEALQKQKNLYHFLHRIDEISGIGQYGVLFIGIDDGLELSKPVEGLDEKGNPVGKPRDRKLLYLRCFDETVVEVATREVNVTNPRYGQPTSYRIIFKDETNPQVVSSQTHTVHWSRVIHVADNRMESEIFGRPRMEPVINRIIDLKKVLGGSGEMFWKGAFPGFSFELLPGVSDISAADTELLKEEIDEYMNGLQRYMKLAGITAKPLSPQVADPTAHINSILLAIAITLGIPKRILMGTEEAKLASSQDAKTWNKKVGRRQERYLTPMLIRPFIDRLIDVGILPRPGEDGFQVWWPDLNTSTDEEKANVNLKRTQALSIYISGNVDQIIPPAEYLDLILEMGPEEIQAVVAASKEYAADVEKIPTPPPPPGMNLPENPGGGDIPGEGETTPDEEEEEPEGGEQ